VTQILDASGRPYASAIAASPRWARTRAQARHLLARYDAAQTTDDNSRHWQHADHLSAQAANTLAVRRTLRSRARYECVENNSLAKGMILTLANDAIGTTPRLQLYDESAKPLERSFTAWAKEIRLGAKLRTARASKAVDGEIFLLFVTNNRLRHPVKLDVRLVEGDQISTPDFDAGAITENAVDGIRFDEEGNPAVYHLLRFHPGGSEYGVFASLEYDEVPAANVLHWYREDRPGQKRGIPEVTSALPLFAQLRRFVLATIAAAETAADFAAVLYTDGASLSDSQIEALDALDAIEIEKRMLTTMPMGWKIEQLKAEHPTTTFEMFRRAMIAEIARCLNMPYNVAAADSSSHNYAAARLDSKSYHRSLDVERSDCEASVLDPVFFAFTDEAALLPGVVPDGIGPLGDIRHRWFFDGHPHADPSKEAAANHIAWFDGHLTDDDILFARGKDPDEHYEQLAKQQAMRRKLGLPTPGLAERQAKPEPGAVERGDTSEQVARIVEREDDDDAEE
jgi:lambda family phage portal protein